MMFLFTKSLKFITSVRANSYSFPERLFALFFDTELLFLTTVLIELEVVLELSPDTNDLLTSLIFVDGTVLREMPDSLLLLAETFLPISSLLFSDLMAVVSAPSFTGLFVRIEQPARAVVSANVAVFTAFFFIYFFFTIRDLLVCTYTYYQTVVIFAISF